MVAVKKQFYSCVHDYAKLFCFDNLTMLLYSKMHQMQDKTPVKMTDYELKIFTYGDHTSIHTYKTRFVAFMAECPSCMPCYCKSLL